MEQSTGLTMLEEDGQQHHRAPGVDRVGGLAMGWQQLGDGGQVGMGQRESAR